MTARELRPADLADTAINLRLPLSLRLQDVGAITLERLILCDVTGHWVAIANQGSDVLLVKLWRYAAYQARPWQVDQQNLAKAGARGAHTLEQKFETNAVDVPLKAIGYSLERPTTSLRESWRTAKTEADRQQIVTALLDLLAHLHESGIEVSDFCMDDYLSVQGSWAVISGARLRCMPSRTKVRDLPSLEAVAGLFSAIGHYESDRLRYLVGEYYRARNWAPHRVNDAYERAYVRQFNRVKQQFLRDFTVAGGRYRDFYHTRVQALIEPGYCSAGLGVLLDDLPMAMQAGDAVDGVDQGRLAQVAVEGEAFWLHSFDHAEAMHSAWRGYALMALAGITTAKPVGRIEPMAGLGRGRSYILTEPVSGQSLAAMLVNNPHLELPEPVLAMLERIVANDLFHGCLTPDRMVFTDDSWLFVRAYNLSDHTLGLRKRQVADLARFIDAWPAAGQADLINKLQASKWLSPLMAAVLQRGVA